MRRFDMSTRILYGHEIPWPKESETGDYVFYADHIAALESADAREAELRAEVRELIRTAVQRDAPVHKEQEQIIEWLRARVSELEGMVPRWVPVSERLPECEVDVLTFSVDHPEDEIVLESRISDCDWTTTLGEPTHWMPLPAAPVSPSGEKEEV